ncbi:MAG: hypothetical protein WCX95_02065 [Candidatus Gracilibacteria bacterium]
MNSFLIVLFLVPSFFFFGVQKEAVVPVNEPSDLGSEKSYENEKYGFSLELPDTWRPVGEESRGALPSEKVVEAFNLIGNNSEVIQIGSVPLYLRSVAIGVVPMKDVAARKKLDSVLYKEFLGKNDKYEFYYEAELLYMYPYGCNNIESDEEEKLCAEYKPAYEETKDIVESFKAI